jgi:hypothetical protein
MTGEFFATKDEVLLSIDENIRGLKKECQTELTEIRGDKSAYAEVMQARKFLELDFGSDTPIEFSQHLCNLIEAAEAIDKEMQMKEAQASQIEERYGAKIQALESSRSELVKLAWHEDKTRARVNASNFSPVHQEPRFIPNLPLSTREQ